MYINFHLIIYKSLQLLFIVYFTQSSDEEATVLEDGDASKRDVEQEIIKLTQKMLTSITTGDFEAYR